MANWTTTTAGRVREGQQVRLTWDDGRTFEGRVTRKFRGANFNVEDDRGGMFVYSRMYGDTPATIETR